MTTKSKHSLKVINAKRHGPPQRYFIYHIFIFNHLKTFRYANRYDVYVPYISICDLLLKVTKTVHFFKRKRCSQKCETRENTTGAGLRPKKVIPCIWRNWKDIVIPRNQTFNSDNCCSHLDQSKTAGKALGIGQSSIRRRQTSGLFADLT